MSDLKVRFLPLLVAILPLVFACASEPMEEIEQEANAAQPVQDLGTITVYSGRSKSLVGPLLDRAAKEVGVKVRVRYGGTAELAAAILEEGRRSPADVFFAQDAGALGALSKADFFTPLPDATLNRVEPRFRSPTGEWVGVSGRARVVAYNTDRLTEEDLPESILEFTDPQWRGRIGWPPTNGSFQAFVTALRKVEGEEVAQAWLLGIRGNDPKAYPNNITTLLAVADGEVDVGFINHYYLFRQLTEKGDSFSARISYPKHGDVGALINVTGVGVLSTAENKAAAFRFVEYLLSEAAQEYFATETFEYPLVAGIPTPSSLVPMSEIKTPDLDLSDLDDLEGTLKLLRDLGIL